MFLDTFKEGWVIF